MLIRGPLSFFGNFDHFTPLIVESPRITKDLVEAWFWFNAESQRGREGERERGREGERERGREGEREKGREGERERGRGGKRGRERERMQKQKAVSNARPDTTQACVINTTQCLLDASRRLKRNHCLPSYH